VDVAPGLDDLLVLQEAPEGAGDGALEVLQLDKVDGVPEGQLQESDGVALVPLQLRLPLAVYPQQAHPPRLHVNLLKHLQVAGAVL
jgi:hypothetical protein